MTSTKSSSTRHAPLVAKTLKTAGLIVTLAALLDMLILPFPFQATTEWQIALVTQVVDRGIVPMVGIALFIAGSWFDGASAGDRKTWQDGRFWMLVLASLLGLLYLIMFPLHLNNVRLNNTQAIERINQEATQTGAQLDARLNAEVQQQRGQIQQLLGASDDQLNQAQQGGLITAQQADLIRQFKREPDTLDPYIEQRVTERRTQLQAEIAARKEQALQALKTESLKSGLRIGISSLLLAIGYIVIGWSGLRTLTRGTPNR